MTNMKKALLATFTSLVFLMQGISQQNFLDTIWSGGIMRTFRVYVPAIYDEQTARPLVFSFHGSGLTAAFYEDAIKLKSVADTANFILITPNATVDAAYPQEGQLWNNFSCCNLVNDVLFVSDLIDSLVVQFNLDTLRIYATGYSSGGFMCYDLACQLNDRIAAVASVCGSMEVQRLNMCNPMQTVPVLEIHGTNDPFVPFNGGTFNAFTLAAVDTLMQFWVGSAGCSADPIITNLPNTNTTDGSTVEHYTWPNCVGGSSIELLKVIGGGHTWPGNPGSSTNRDIIADQEIWRFFLKHKLSEPSGTIENPLFLKLSVFPNPASENLNISVDENQNFRGHASLMIADLYGRIVVSKELAPDDWGKSLTLNLNEIPAGGYFFILDAGAHGRSFQRFVVLR